MSELVSDCPRCGSINMTFDLYNQNIVAKKYDWQAWLEVFCICRNCLRSTIFIVSQKEVKFENIVTVHGLEHVKKSVNSFINVEGFVSLKDVIKEQPPEYLPPNIKASFEEGAACLSIDCYNAAGTMFRLCLDLATKSMLPESAEGLNSVVRRSLGLRLNWMLDNTYLPESFRDLSTCIKDDGNDGAHEGTLDKNDATDILDFTFVVLERIYTEPERIRLANERRTSRRNSNKEE